MTPFHLRDRLKALVKGKEAPAPVAAPAPVQTPAPVTTPAAPTPKAVAPAPVAAAPVDAAPVDPEAAAKAALDEERQRKHWARTRKGMLKWLVDHGGEGPMKEMHDHSEKKYFAGHRAFSRLMEEYTAEGLVDYDSATVRITDAGRAALSE